MQEKEKRESVEVTAVWVESERVVACTRVMAVEGVRIASLGQ